MRVWILSVLFLFHCSNEKGSQLYESFFVTAVRSVKVTISGKVAKGKISQARVDVYRLNANGTCNTGAGSLAYTYTDTEGDYSLAYLKTGAPICVVSSPSGYSKMYDEGTKTEIDWNGSTSLTMIMREPSVTTKTGINLTPFSRIISARLAAIAANNKGTSILNKQITYSNKAVSVMFGFQKRFGKSVRAASTPIDMDTLEDDFDNGIDLNEKANFKAVYTTALLGASSVAAGKSKKGSKITADDVEKYVAAAAEDIADGKADGENSKGEILSVNGAPLGANPLTGTLMTALGEYVKADPSLGISSSEAASASFNQAPVFLQPIPSEAIESGGSSGLFTVGGTISGLVGTVVLQNNGGNNLSVNANGSFTFAGTVASGSAYSVTVLTQPAGQVCVVTDGANTVSANVTNVTVVCVIGGTGNTLWAKSVTSGTENSVFYGVSFDSSGSPYAVGYITGTAGNVNFGTGAVNSNNAAYSLVSVKYNSSGTAQWTQTVTGGSLTSEGTAAGIDSSGNFFAAGVTAAETKNLGANALTGAFNGTNFLTKYNSSGTNQWVTAATAGAVGSNTMKGISSDSTGNMYLSGYTGVNGTFTFSGINMTALVNNNNPILIKFNSSGAAQWIRTASTLPTAATFAGNTVDPSGNIITGGYMFGSSVHTFTGVNVNGVFGANANAYIIKYDSSGNVIWAKSNSTAPDWSQFWGFAADSNGNIYAVGFVNTAGVFNFGGVNVNGANAGTNAFIVKYDSNGNVLWAKSTGTAPGASEFLAVSVDSQGNAYAVGRIYGNGTFNFGGVNVTGTHSTYNALIVKYNSSGAVQYAKTTTAGANSSIFYSVKTNDFGNTYAAGVITGNGVFNFGSGSVNGTNSGGYSSIAGNAILVKYE